MSDRKKAIETLKENLCAMCAYGSQNMESCDIRSCDNRDAIKALEQEPTTKNDLGVDAISRADARSLICDIDLKYHTFGMTRKAFKDLYNGMDELPPVTPIRPKGHWLDTGWISECSCCHERSYPFDDTGYGSIYNYFCPNCGADMREVENENDENS